MTDKADQNDRELLELAAKAAGLNRKYYEYLGEKGMIDDDPDSGWWNPLTDDGDALRLAVKLDLSIDPNTLGITVGNFRSLYKLACYESIGKDSYAATRRAIVRAAAEIGKTNDTDY